MLKWTGEDSKDLKIELKGVLIDNLNNNALGYRFKSYILKDGKHESIEDFSTVTLILIPDSNGSYKFKILTCYPEYIEAAAKAA